MVGESAYYPNSESHLLDVWTVSPREPLQHGRSGHVFDVVRSREAGFMTHMIKTMDFVRLEAMIRRVSGDVATR